MKVTNKVVSEVAELAQLTVADDDRAALASAMQTIFDLAEQMQAIDTSQVEPIANPLDAVQRLRQDAVTEVDQRETFQAIAPLTRAGLYLVPRVVE